MQQLYLEWRYIDSNGLAVELLCHIHRSASVATAKVDHLQQASRHSSRTDTPAADEQDVWYV